MNELKSDLLLCLLITILLPMPLSAANDDRPKLDLSGQWQAALDPYRLLTTTSPRPLTVAALCHALLGTHSRSQLKKLDNISQYQSMWPLTTIHTYN